MPERGCELIAPERLETGELCDLTATEVVELTRRGLLDREVYLSSLRARSLELSGYHAMASMFSDPPSPGAWRTVVGGVLDGVPVTVKDNVDVAGLPTTGGTPALAENVAQENAPIIELLASSGAQMMGKNVMHELALGATSCNPWQGTPRNPWDPERMCGGSSGGTAAAVSLGLAPIGIGSDTGGSVRMPAALCGIFGFRPSLGRYPEGGVLSLSPTRDAVGPLARSFDDILLVDAVLSATPRPARSRPNPESIRLGFTPLHTRDLQPDVAESYRSSGEILRSNGIQVVEVPMDDIIVEAQRIATTILWGEAGESLQEYLRPRLHGGLQTLVRAIASPDVLRLLVSGLGSVSASQYAEALQSRRELRKELKRRLSAAEVNALVYPTVPVTAPRLFEDEEMELNGRLVPVFPTLIRNTDMGGVLGLPGVSIPIAPGSRTSMPVGLEFSAPPGEDDSLLATVAAIEPLISQVTAPSQLPLTAS